MQCSTVQCSVLLSSAYQCIVVFGLLAVLTVAWHQSLLTDYINSSINMDSDERRILKQVAGDFWSKTNPLNSKTKRIAFSLNWPLGQFSHRVVMSVCLFVFLSVTLQNTHFRGLWRPLVKE